MLGPLCGLASNDWFLEHGMKKQVLFFLKISLLSSGLFNHKMEVIEGILADPSREILQQFFARRR